MFPPSDQHASSPRLLCSHVPRGPLVRVAPAHDLRIQQVRAHLRHPAHTRARADETQRHRVTAPEIPCPLHTQNTPEPRSNGSSSSQIMRRAAQSTGIPKRTNNSVRANEQQHGAQQDTSLPHGIPGHGLRGPLACVGAGGGWPASWCRCAGCSLWWSRGRKHAVLSPATGFALSPPHTPGTKSNALPLDL